MSCESELLESDGNPEPNRLKALEVPISESRITVLKVSMQLMSAYPIETNTVTLSTQSPLTVGI
jgi:hypothetical protein